MPAAVAAPAPDEKARALATRGALGHPEAVPPAAPIPAPTPADAAVWDGLLGRAGLPPHAAWTATVLYAADSHWGARRVVRLDRDGGPSVVVKQGPMEMAGWHARQIAPHMAAQRALAGVADATVPEILGIDRAARAVLMRHVAGPTAEARMKATPDWSVRLRIAARCARWLGRLHATGGETRPLALRDPPRTVAHGRDLFAALSGIAARRIAARTGAPARHGPVHGDPTFGNFILAPDGGVAGLDFSAPRPRPPEGDVAKLLVRTQVRFGAREGRTDGWIDAWAAIRDAYAGPLDDEVLRLHVMLEAMTIWRSAPQQDPAKPFRPAGLRHLAEALIADPDGTAAIPPVPRAGGRRAGRSPRGPRPRRPWARWFG